MYSTILEHDGRVDFRTHVPPEDLSPDHAREVLDFLEPVLRRLRRAAAAPRRPEGRGAIHWIERRRWNGSGAGRLGPSRRRAAGASVAGRSSARRAG